MKAIADKIVKEIDEFLAEIKKDYVDERFNYEIDHFFLDEDENQYLVDVTGYYKNEFNESEQTNCVLLKFFISKEFEQIQITNIFLPRFMHHKGIGKELIKIIFKISQEVNYGLFLVDMVNSFYCRMINRGALPCVECDDAVQIVSATKLD